MKIKYETDNDCVGCPQGCVHCGRGKYLYAVAIVCENCDSEEEELYKTDDGWFCLECLRECKKVTVDKINNNMADYDDEEWEEVE